MIDAPQPQPLTFSEAVQEITTRLKFNIEEPEELSNFVRGIIEDVLKSKGSANNVSCEDWEYCFSPYYDGGSGARFMLDVLRKENGKIQKTIYNIVFGGGSYNGLPDDLPNDWVVCNVSEIPQLVEYHMLNAIKYKPQNSSNWRDIKKKVELKSAAGDK